MDRKWVKLADNLVGHKVTEFFVDQLSVTFLFENAALAIEGPWKLLDSSNVVIDYGDEGVQNDEFHAWKVLDSTVIRSTISDENTLELVFDCGLTLRAFADDDGFEDWGLRFRGGAWVIINGV
ncbi:MAG TPA: DUF6188 family protein [Capsulimonadaceae bacterium]